MEHLTVTAVSIYIYIVIFLFQLPSAAITPLKISYFEQT